MKPEWHRFAPLGLYLALLAALFSIGYYIVQREFNLYLQIGLGLVVVGLAVYAFLDPSRVRDAFAGRQARYGSNALVLTIAFVGITVVVNYLVYQNSKRWDLTEDKQFTLAQETIDTLKSLPEPVSAVAFFTASTPSDSAKGLLDQYKFYSDGKFDYQFIDPNDNPVAAEQAKITRDGTIALKMGEDQELVTVSSEQELTGGLVRLLNPEKRPIYFLTGHGEYNPDDTGDRAYSQVKRTLEGKNYSVQTLNILATNQIPEDAKVIVIAGPRKQVTDTEIEALKAFLEKGGAMVVLEEPTVLTDFGDSPDPLADYLAQTWGVKFGDNVIVDPNSQQIFAPFAAQYGDHIITQKMQNVATVFPSARSVSADSAITGVSQVEIVLTAPNAYAESSMDGLLANPPSFKFDEGQDIAGPISLAVVSENFDTDGKVVVFGDSDFANDSNFYALGNGDLLVNALDWAAGQEQLISLTPKESTNRLLVPPQRSVMNLILLGTVIIVPGLALLAGIVVWVVKRRRG